MNRCCVLLFIATGLHAYTHPVTGHGPYHRRVRITAFERVEVVDWWWEYGAIDAGTALGLIIQHLDATNLELAHDVLVIVVNARQREREVAGSAVRLATLEFIRPDLVRVVNAQSYRLIAVIHRKHAGVLHIDSLRARTLRAVVVRTRRCHCDFFDQVREYRRVLLSARRVDRAAERVLGITTIRWITDVFHCHGGNCHHVTSNLAVLAGCLAVLISTDVYAGFIGMLEVAVLKIELAMRLHLTSRVE